MVSGGQVVDEWIRQAQQAARLLGGVSSTPLADTSGQMIRVASDMMAAWFSMLGVVPPSGTNGSAHQPAKEPAWAPNPAPNPAAPAGPEASEPVAPYQPAPTHATAGPRVRIAVTSRRPVDVTLDLHRPGGAAFRVLDLRPEQGDAPRIQGTTLEALDGDGYRLHLAVPDDHPQGTYHAVVLDAALDCVVGTVTLRIP